MSARRRLACLAAAFLLASGFTAQPLDERTAQEMLPMSDDPVWTVLGAAPVSLDEQDGLYSIAFTDGVKALEGKTLTITGFMLPLEAGETFRQFLLSKRTPTCAFCPPGEPNEMVYVVTLAPVAWDDGPITVTGRFLLANDREMGLFYRLDEAALE